MVDSIRHWCRVSGLIEQGEPVRSDKRLPIPLLEQTNPRQRGHFRPTSLGSTIFGEGGKNGFDPYLDDPATLWLIHWQIATNTHQATTWYWAFNVLRGSRFTRPIFARELHKWAQQQKIPTRPVSENTLHRDVTCFIRTYCQSRGSDAVIEETFDCPLVELNLMAELPDSNGYEFQRGSKGTLPLAVVAWALDIFWKKHFFSRDSLSFSEVMYAPSSPGQVFRLDEDSMATYLENLDSCTAGAFYYDETAGLKQVYRNTNTVFDSMELLRGYYG